MKIQTKKGRTNPKRKSVPRRSALLRPYSVWCSTDPSVIRGLKSTDLLYHGGKTASRNQINKNYRFSKPIHVKVDKSRRNGIETYKKRGGSDNRPNVIIISRRKRNVNWKIVENDKISIIEEIKLYILYNIPSCVFGNLWYDIATKRWYQWSLKNKTLNP